MPTLLAKLMEINYKTKNQHQRLIITQELYKEKLQQFPLLKDLKEGKGQTFSFSKLMLYPSCPVLWISTSAVPQLDASTFCFLVPQ